MDPRPRPSNDPLPCPTTPGQAEPRPRPCSRCAVTMADTAHFVFGLHGRLTCYDMGQMMTALDLLPDQKQQVELARQAASLHPASTALHCRLLGLLGGAGEQLSPALSTALAGVGRGGPAAEVWRAALACLASQPDLAWQLLQGENSPLGSRHHHPSIALQTSTGLVLVCK